MENELIQAIEKYEKAFKIGKLEGILSAYFNLINVKNNAKEKLIYENKDINIKLNVSFKEDKVDIDTIIKNLEEKLIKNMPTIHIKQ